MSTPQVEKWRTLLAWGCVVIFLFAPLVIFIMHMSGLLVGIDKDLEYLSKWYFSIMTVLVSLAGLNTIIQVKNGRKHHDTAAAAEETTTRTPEAPKSIETKL